jgi:hypothetical protein
MRQSSQPEVENEDGVRIFNDGHDAVTGRLLE